MGRMLLPESRIPMIGQATADTAAWLLECFNLRLRALYRPGVWSTYFNPRVFLIQFGEQCVRRMLSHGHVEPELDCLLGRAARPLERLAFLICHEVAHAVHFAKYGGLYTRIDHGPIFRAITVSIMDRFRTFLVRRLTPVVRGKAERIAKTPPEAKHYRYAQSLPGFDGLFAEYAVLRKRRGCGDLESRGTCTTGRGALLLDA